MEKWIIFFVAISLTYYINNFSFTVKEFKISNSKIPKGFQGYRILHISDLHNSNYGKDNSKLIRKILQLDPEVIFYTGDMINKHNLKKDHFRMLIEGLSFKYPAYFVNGNHEDELSEREKIEFISLLNHFGIKYLENERISLEREGEVITLYGLRLPKKYLRNTYDENGDVKLSEEGLRKRLGQVEHGFTMQLAHNPLYFDVYASYGIDLTFSGHVHGGLVRLPFLGGVLSPDRTFFPKYHKGLYSRQDKKMVVSPGIGGAKLRLFNRPALYIIKLQREES